MSRLTDRTAEYRARRAAALDFQEHVHDRLIEARFRNRHERTVGGWIGGLVRKVLTDFAIRDAERNSR